MEYIAKISLLQLGNTEHNTMTQVTNSAVINVSEQAEEAAMCMG